jgi:hypothetical protein
MQTRIDFKEAHAMPWLSAEEKRVTALFRYADTERFNLFWTEELLPLLKNGGHIADLLLIATTSNRPQFVEWWLSHSKSLSPVEIGRALTEATRLPTPQIFDMIFPEASWWECELIDVCLENAATKEWPQQIKALLSVQPTVGPSKGGIQSALEQCVERNRQDLACEILTITTQITSNAPDASDSILVGVAHRNLIQIADMIITKPHPSCTPTQLGINAAYLEALQKNHQDIVQLLLNPNSAHRPSLAARIVFPCVTLAAKIGSAIIQTLLSINVGRVAGELARRDQRTL